MCVFKCVLKLPAQEEAKSPLNGRSVDENGIFSPKTAFFVQKNTVLGPIVDGYFLNGKGGEISLWGVTLNGKFLVPEFLTSSLRGCSHIISAKFGGFQPPLPGMDAPPRPAEKQAAPPREKQALPRTAPPN